MTTETATSLKLNDIAPLDFSDIGNAIEPYNLLADNYGTYLAKTQLELEQEAYTLGEQRFKAQLDRMIQRLNLDGHKAAQPILETIYPMALAAITAKVDKIRSDKRYTLNRLADELADDMITNIAIKISISQIAREGYTPLTALNYSIGSNIEDETRFRRLRIANPAHYKKVIEPNLEKRVDVKYKKEFLKAVESSMLNSEDLTESWKAWTTDECIHLGNMAVEALIEIGFLQLEPRRKEANASPYVVTLTNGIDERIAERATALAGISPVHQPMVVPPRKWTGIKQGAYWSRGQRPVPLIRTPSLTALNRYKDIDMPEVYKAVNIAQETPWKVNSKVLKVVNALTQWEHVDLESWAQLNPEIKPVRPVEADTDETIDKAWRKEMVKYYRKDESRKSQRLQLLTTIGQANKFEQFKSIWFPSNLDWRGRLYFIPSFNPQGNDMTKGLLTFASGKPVGKEGFFWLKVHGANCAGTTIEETGKKTDKVTLVERVKWVEDNHDMIIECAKSPLDNTEWMAMDSPFCFLAFCFEYKNVVSNGLNTVVSLPVAFDGSCSGIQHFSCMLKDHIGGAAVNLVPSPEPSDIYQVVANKVIEMLNADLAGGSVNYVDERVDKKTGEIKLVKMLGTQAMAKGWLDFGVNRKVTKRSVMTLPYGSAEYGFRDQLLDDIIKPVIDKGLDVAFNDENNFQYAGYMAKLIWESVSVTVVAAVEAMKWLKVAAKLLAAEVKDGGEVVKPCLPVHWTTTDGFPVCQEYRAFESKTVKLTLLGDTIRVRIQDSRKWTIDRRKQESGISPNFVHSNDANHLRTTVVEANEKYGITQFALIHDSFGTLPADAGNLFKCVRETMVNIYTNHDVLEEFRTEVMKQLTDEQLVKMPMLPAKGNLVIADIANSEFAFA
ncbi:MAG: hypothetical protein [Caudoviricetes sp.]|nr:MAG: hypothetical protein [Caudoviricetes sp.]